MLNERDGAYKRLEMKQYFSQVTLEEEITILTLA
jgi:hypothetical protein